MSRTQSTKYQTGSKDLPVQKCVSMCFSINLCYVLMDLLQERARAATTAGALVDSQHQVEALRQLYNQELSRASRAALDLQRAQVS